MTKKQFDILSYLCEFKGEYSQRQLSVETDMSVGSVNKTLKELENDKYIDGMSVTDKGVKALEPYKVNRAIIIAAGFGSRLVPITLNTPKPLVRVNGKKIIETTLDALNKAGIEEVYIVRGYLREQFDQLLYDYKNIKFIDNPLYNEANNISSIILAKDLLKNTYVLEADLFLYNPKIIRKYQYSSNFLGMPVEKTDDWCYYLKDGIIKEISVGGENCYQMIGISYWTEEDGEKLSKDVEKVFTSPGGKERYWDQVPLLYCKDNYQVSARLCKREDLIEIDTFTELTQIDKSYLIK